MDQYVIEPDKGQQPLFYIVPMIVFTFINGSSSSTAMAILNLIIIISFQF